MQIQETVSEDEMVVAFLRAEIDSPRWGSHVLAGLSTVGRSRSLIDRPELGNPAEEAARARVLAYRGYGHNAMLFADFPPSVRWQRAVLDSADLGRLKVLNQDHWVAYSGSARLASNAAAFLGSERSAAAEKKNIAAVVTDLRAGRMIPEVIVVGASFDALVILEGHVRVMAALCMNSGQALSALVGTAPRMSEWRFY